MDSSDSEKLRSQFNADWRIQKTDLVDQIGYFYHNQELADVFFVFHRNESTTKIAAHQLVLSAASEVFQKEIAYARQKDSAEEMSSAPGPIRGKKGKRASALGQTFYKKSENKDSAGHGEHVTSSLEIEVTDPNVEPDAFRTMQKYIYEGYKNVSFTGESVMAVLYVAKKYLLLSLIHCCESFLLENLSAENVFTVLQYTIDCETDKKLEEKCAEFLCAKTKEVLKSNEFPKISSKCLEFLLEQNSLNASEADLFNGAIQWAKSKEAKEKSSLKKGKNIRSKLGEALHLIRFSTMNAKEFADFVVPSEVLTAEEQRDIMLMICGQKPVGQPICKINCPRGEISHLTSSKILSQSTQRTIKFSVLVHIEHFHSFVTSKAEYESVSINFNNTEWYIRIELYKYCQTENKYIAVTSSSPEQPEFFAAFVYGERSDKKECSFDVNETFKFKRPSTAKEVRYSHKFIFNSTKNLNSWGCAQLARIDDILDVQKGYLLDNSLELLVDVSISECE